MATGTNARKKFLLGAIYSFQLSAVVGEENWNDDGNTTTDTVPLQRYEQLMIIILTVVFTLLVSFAGSIVLYMSYLDRNIVKRYRTEGKFCEGRVIGCTFGRVNADNQREYVVTVEYRRTLNENYKVTIHKEFRVQDTDMYRLDDRLDGEAKDTTSSYLWHGTTEEDKVWIEDPESIIIERQLTKEDFAGFKEFSAEPKGLELLVIREHLQSAIPVKEIEQKMTWQYHATAVGFIVFAMLVCFFCFLVIRHEILTDADKANQNIEWNILYACAALIAFQIPAIHCFLRSTLQKSLEDGYFKTGIVGTDGQDDSTIPTLVSGKSRDPPKFMSQLGSISEHQENDNDYTLFK
ncbi:unnamed protein product [Cylindrotheca closterium]|uniref:Uncharacterized protein n=1 Tax=Cylindrotheca closterium TaxID=2856 RepID=A0AAD2FQ88_9STRA|nr:unnamed protein product [Cylindrotheca closterium]